MKKVLVIVIAVAFSWVSLAQAGTTKTVKHNFDSFNNPEFELRFDKNRQRSLFWSPIASHYFPGLGQALEGQNNWALSYGSIGAVGLVGSELLKPQMHSIPLEINMIRRAYMTAGSFSAYHDFHTAIRSYKDEFHFIKKEDSIKDLLIAPFEFSHLKNPRVSIPLMIAGLAMFSAFGDEDIKPIYNISAGSRAAFTFGTSYMAGTGEEAYFRGYMLPALHYATGENFWLANGLQALAFGAVHDFKGRVFPVFEASFGLYFGWLARESGYSLKPGIFLHNWWDVLVFARELLNPNGVQNAVKVDLINLTF